MRECGNCTSCCDGTLSGDVLGHTMGSGKPCPFVDKNKGCKIYERRPEDPCISFKCLWLSDNTIPDFMKPDVSNVVLIKKMDIGHPYLSAVETVDGPMTAEILSHVIQYAYHTGQNLVYTLNAKKYYLGSPQFMHDAKTKML